MLQSQSRCRNCKLNKLQHAMHKSPESTAATASNPSSRPSQARIAKGHAGTCGTAGSASGPAGAATFAAASTFTAASAFTAASTSFAAASDPVTAQAAVRAAIPAALRAAAPAAVPAASADNDSADDANTIDLWDYDDCLEVAGSGSLPGQQIQLTVPLAKRRRVCRLQDSSDSEGPEDQDKAEALIQVGKLPIADLLDNSYTREFMDELQQAARRSALSSIQIHPCQQTII